MKRLDPTVKQEVSYCVPLWLRDEQIKLATARIKARITAHPVRDEEPIALVNFGPSLRDTWEQLRSFSTIMTCSGAHKFLVERGIRPTYHVEVDPRPHKVALIGPPCPETIYLIASTCHPAVFDHLEGCDVRLWHVFDAQEDALRTLPHGEWALTGGCSVGLRTMTIARFLGYTQQHIFGMDGNLREHQSHTDAHPNAPKGWSEVEYPAGSGRLWATTPSMLEAARGTWHELNQMPDVRPTFYGEGLVQTMAKDYVPQPVGKGKAVIGFHKPETISAEYAALNARLHRDNLAYGVGGGKHAETVQKLADSLKTRSVLDYGAGKGYLAKALDFPIWEYDPAIPDKAQSPRPADLVVCTDVLEHIEPDKLGAVLADLQRCVRKIGYFTIHTGPAMKQLADGRNAHLIQQPQAWWTKTLKRFFVVGQIVAKGPVLYVVVAPKPAKEQAA